MTRPPHGLRRPSELGYFPRFEGKPIWDLWLFWQTATRRRRRAVRVWTLRATFSRKIVNFRDRQLHTSWSLIHLA
jgi:hypothetical protein